MSSPLETVRAANLLSKDFVHLESTDRFRFSCRMCGGCCKNTAPLLNSYDLMVLRRHMGTTTGELLDKQVVEMFFSPTTNWPRCGFVFKSVNGGEQSCPLMIPLDDPSAKLPPFDWKDWEKSIEPMANDHPETEPPNFFGCRVYPARPTMCRSYPLGRALVTDLKMDIQEAEIIMQVPDSYCNGHVTDKETSAGDWLESNGCWQYWQANDVFMRMMARLEASGFGQGVVEGDVPGKKKDVLGSDQNPWPEDLFSLVFAVMYEFDDTAFFQAEFPKSSTEGDHGTDMQALKRIGEVIDLLIELKLAREEGNEETVRDLQTTVGVLIGEG